MNLLPGYGSVGIEQARLDILRFKYRILTQQGVHRVSSSQLSQHMLHSESHSSDNWLAAEYVGADRDAFEQFVILGHGILLW